MPRREGPIIKGGGVSRPDHMDDDEWAEYKRTAEYAHEVSYVADEDVPDYDDMQDEGPPEEVDEDGDDE